MQVTQAPERYTNETNDPVSHYEPEHSRWDQVSLMRSGNELIVRAREARTEEIMEKRFTLGERTFKAVQPPTGEQRRDIDDDLLDLLLLEGYAVGDTGVQQY